MIEKKFQTGSVYSCVAKRACFLRLCGRHKKGRKEKQSKTHVEQNDETGSSRGANSSVRSSILGSYAAGIQAELEDRGRKRRPARIFDLCRYHQTITWSGEIPRGHRRLVFRYGRTCVEVRGKVVWIGKQENQAPNTNVSTPFVWAITNSQMKKCRQLEDCQKLVQKLLEIRLFRMYRETWHVFGLQISWQEQSSNGTSPWQTLGLMSSIRFETGYRRFCHVGNTASECRHGLFRDVDFAGDFKAAKSTSEGMCRTFVSVSWKCNQQTGVSREQDRSRNYLTRHWSESGKNSCAQFTDMVTNVLQPLAGEIPCATPNSKRRNQPWWTRMFTQSTMYLQTRVSPAKECLCLFSKKTMLWSAWS